MAFLRQHALPSLGMPGRHGPAWLPLLLVAAAMLGASALRAQDRQYQLKAAFLINFAQYVEWPSEAFPTNDAPIVFGVLGQNPFGNALKELVFGEVVNGRKAVVQEFRSVRDIGRCHVLFIADSERSRLPAILRALRGRSILTVSDLERFDRDGGIIRFVTEGRVRFRINVPAAQNAGLTISSKLLRLAEGVDRAEEK
jgi:hypothetical protein